ncbi:medium-chain fatty acid-CoA ligase faa2, partial [Coemansia sp. RSA 2671]
MPAIVKQKSYRVPNSEVPGSTYILRHLECKDSLEVPGIRNDYATNVFGMLQYSAKHYGSRDFLGRRSYNQQANKFGDFQWITYSEAHERVLKIGS